MLPADPALVAAVSAWPLPLAVTKKSSQGDDKHLVELDEHALERH
jgi:hypothetical protein